MPKSLKIDAASHMSVVDAIQLAAEILGMQEGLDPDASHFFSLALREAVVNAINHGNGRDPNRRVKVALRANGRGNLVFTVKDQGEGFEPSEVTDPRTPENLDRGSGRGVFYMHQFSDRVDFSFPDEGGTVVRLEKQVPSE
jgi:serine/threonine-protein kinase RsbW